MTSTTGSVANQLYFANGCYDPDNTGVGTQPASFDDFMSLYLWGCVESARLVVIAKQTSATVPGSLCVCPLNGSAPAAIYNMDTNAYAQHAMLTINQPEYVFDYRMSTKDMVGCKTFDLVRADINSWFSLTTNPSSPMDWYYALKYVSSDLSSTSSILVDVKIHFDVTLFKRDAESQDFERIAKRRAALDAAEKRLKARASMPARRVVMGVPDATDAKHVQTRENACLVAGDRKVVSSRSTDAKASATSKASWGELSDDDEATFADFLRWKQSTSAPPAVVASKAGVG